MSNLLNIYNENFGYQVATNGTYIAVGNPNSKPYTCQEGYARLGEVVVYHKNQFGGTNYSLVKKYRRRSLASLGFVSTYYTEQSSSMARTASFILEDGSSLVIPLECNLLVLEDGTSIPIQSGYGRSVALCDKYMAVGDMAFSESIADGSLSFASVDVYQMYDSSSTTICSVAEDFTLPSYPICTITGSVSEQFGKSIAISNKFLLVGAPTANNGAGYVYVYEKVDTCGYSLHSILTSGDGGQKLFGSAVAIDKTFEDKIAVGTMPTTQSMVCVFQLSNTGWDHIQSLQQDTASNWLVVQNSPATEFYPMFPQTASRYGYSVALCEKGLVVGAPNDLIYVEYSGSSTIRQRGAFYFYYQSAGSSQYVLGKKLYGDDTTFKDNMLGYSVDMTNQYVLVGSPKPYFPFSSIYLSSSIEKFNTNFEKNDFGSSTFNGQALLYKWFPNVCSSSVILTTVTTAPIAYRKRVGECFTAYGSSVAISDKNLVIGSPAPLNDDMYLQTPILVEQSGSGQVDCSFTSQEVVVQLKMEDIICDCSEKDINDGSGGIVYVIDQPITDVFGKAFIYDFGDLQKDAVIGNVFYNNDRMVVNNTGSILYDLLKDPHNSLNDYIYGTFQSQITFNEKQYICTVEPGEFNVSTNPTAITGSLFEYGIINKKDFDFNNLDIILRYINYKLTTSHKESWWTVLIDGDVQQSMFSFFTSSIYDYSALRMTPELFSVLSTKNFDVNNDGVVDYGDAFLIWNYYIQNLQIENYKQYISPISKRKNYDDIIKFLDMQTGWRVGNKVKSEFFSYHYSASVDPTGSYLAPYITQVGLYTGADLVAVGKIANPIKNNGQIPINIVVKWDT